MVPRLCLQLNLTFLVKLSLVLLINSQKGTSDVYIGGSEKTSFPSIFNESPPPQNIVNSTRGLNHKTKNCE